MDTTRHYVVALLLLCAACGTGAPLEGPEETVRILNAAGEYPAANELTAPQGAALTATNVVVDVPQKYSAHRGMEASADSGHALTAFSLYQGDVIAHAGADGKLLRLHNGTWSEYSGTYYAPTGEAMSFQEANGSLFFTTSLGVYRLDGVTATPVASGLAQSLPGTVALSSGTGSALEDGFATAYRSNWALNVDDGGTGRLVEGAPSPRLVVANASGSTKNVDLTFPIPSMPSGAYLRVFRADAVPNGILPVDEMRQVYERAPTPTELSAGTFSFTDATPDTVKGGSAYWSANTGDGLAQSNYTSPLAHGLALYSDSMFGASVDGVHRLTMTLLGTGAGGLQADDRLTITRGASAELYVAATSEAFPTQYKVFTSGTPAENVANTVASLVRAINSRSGGFLHAFATDPDGTRPGEFLLESRTLDQTEFIVTQEGSGRPWLPAARAYVGTNPLVRASNVVTATTPVAHGLSVGDEIELYYESWMTPDPLFPVGTVTVASVPTTTSFTYAQTGANGTGANTDYIFRTTGRDVNSSPGTALNAVAWTKRYEPDHWPLANLNTVGGARDTLWWVQPLDRWLFLGSDAGLFRLTGNADDGFSSPEEGAPWDSSTRFLGRRNVAVLDGRAYAIGLEGIVTWSEGSKPQNVDAPIQKEIRDAVAQYPDAVAKYGFMFADSTHHKLYVFLPESASATSATLSHVLNFPQGGEPGWTRLTSTFPGMEQGAVAGMAPPETGGKVHLLPLGGGATDRTGTVLFARLTGANTDYQGPEGQGIPAEVKYLPSYADEPERWKHWTWTRIFTEAPCSRITFGMATEAAPAWEYQVLPDVDPLTAPVPVEDPVRSIAWKTIISASADGTSKARAKALSLSVSHNTPSEPFHLLGIEVKARAYGSGQ